MKVEVIALKGQLDKKMYGVKVKDLRQRASREIQKLATSSLMMINFMIWPAVFIGLLLSVYGFTMWYKRVQKYHDLILKNEAGV